MKNTNKNTTTKPKVLLTCPPMIGRYNCCSNLLSDYEVTIPEFSQRLTESELIEIMGEYDGWIAGDDPATEAVIKAAVNLKVLIKWGIGVDNIDRDILNEQNIKFHNTPGMFGNEVADVAIGYLIGITRHLFAIDREVRKGNWIKPAGISLSGKKVCLVGFGDIGKNIARRLAAMKMNVWVVDPMYEKFSDAIEDALNVKICSLEEAMNDSVVTILACPLLPTTKGLINKKTLSLMKPNSYLVNVSRGGLVVEDDVIAFLEDGILRGFASDVFENEPLDPNHNLLHNGYNVICGSHNASNTEDAVDKTNEKAIELLRQYI